MTARSVLVTGGARRLGAAIARRFDAAGWHVIIHYRDSADEAQALAQSLSNAETVRFDLADPGKIAAAVAGLRSTRAEWTGLVNSAAVFEWDDHERVDAGTFGRAIAVNALAPVMLAQQFLQGETGGSRFVINVLDQKIANLNSDFFSYTMAKQALAAATSMLAMGCRGRADRVHGLCPGAMLPSFDQRRDEHETSGRMNLLGRLTTPAELADAALFLAGGALANGETLFVDSGQHLLSQDRDVLFLARENR